MKQILVLLFVISFQLSNCTNNSDPKYYQLTVSVTPDNGGMVAPTQDSLLEEGSELRLTALANDEYAFSGWTGDFTSQKNPFTIEIESATDLIANFLKKKYQLQIDIQGNGQVTETIIKPKTDYEHGTLVRVEAVPDSGWSFINWEGDLNSTNISEELEITKRTELTANFERTHYNLTINISGRGRVEQLNGSEVKNIYENGSEVSLVAIPDSMWVFDNWGESSADTFRFKMTNDTTITANFKEGILKACVPKNIDAYNYKLDNDSTHILDWNIFYDEQFERITSYRKGIDFIKTGEWPLNYIDADLEYNNDLISYIFMDFEGSDEEIFFSWADDKLVGLTTKHIQSDYNVDFTADIISYSSECGIDRIKGATNDDTIYDLYYSYSVDCLQFEISTSNESRFYESSKSIFYDVKGLPGMLGASYNFLVTESIPILLFNPNNARLEKIETEVYNREIRRFVTHVETYDYQAFITNSDYPRYFTVELFDENDILLSKDTYQVSYYCKYE